ncbi:MAG: peptidylprolyl isomerase [Fimbriimonas ginsengisoli]|uniref:Peptidylprolyl isomerase n=1 Tax=Fimbriimonas ginsengisoli TaxID=1005039 RepID=A0A931LUD6_FIMGI|nr:peptidylprolyl isomerase [Fimbriimonas ginsengisoli]
MLSLLLLALAAPQGNAPPPPKPERVLAKVGSEAIRASDVEAYLWDWRGYEALQDLISFRLVEREAKRAGVSVSRQETLDALQQQVTALQSSLPKGKSLEDTMRQQGFPRSRLFLRIRSEQLLDRLVLHDLKPSEFAKVSTLIFRAASEQTSVLAAAIRQADEAYADLAKGEAWHDVLATATTDKHILSTDGLVGWREISAFPPTVAEEMKKLKPGQTTHPAQTKNGIQIFRLEATGDGASAKDAEELRQTYLSAKRPEFLAKLRQAVKIERFYPPAK